MLNKYIALAIELLGAAAIVVSLGLLINFAAGLLAAGFMAFVLGAALENSR